VNQAIPEKTAGSQISVFAILRRYHPDFSGAGRQARQVSARLAKEGFRVVVLTQWEGRAREVSREQFLDGTRVRRLSVVRQVPRNQLPFPDRLSSAFALVSALLNRASFVLSCLWTMLRTAAQPGIMQLYSCNEFTFFLVLVSRLLGLHPVIRMTLMGSDDPVSLARRPLGRLAFRAFAAADAVVSLSTPLTDSYLAAGLDPRKLAQIPNGVDCDQFHPVSHSEKRRLRGHLGLDSCACYIAFVGTAYARKGVDILVEAFVRVAERHDEVSLVIVGPSDFSDTRRYRPERSQQVAAWREQISKARLAARVVWTGEVQDVAAYLQAADIFCFPSRREGMPSAVLEAMAVGLPVVVSSMDGIAADFVDSGQDGYIVAGEDPGLYAERIMRFLSNPEEMENMGRNARQRVEREFSMGRVSSEYANLYRRLVQS